jgi:outer membrane protein
MKKKIIILLVLILNTTLSAKFENEDDTLGNIAIQMGFWNIATNGTIVNEKLNGNTNYKNDLGYDDNKNINIFALDLKNDITWLPNVNINYFKLNNSSSNILTSSRNINNTEINGSISSTLNYSEINTILYGFLYEGPFEFDFGLNIKKIDFLQDIKENNSLALKKVTIIGPSDFIFLPYIALKINLDFIDTVLMAQTSMLSIGDNEAKDYMYSINYRVMKNIYLSYGYKYNSFKTTNSKNTNEIYDVQVKGNYISCKVLF